MALGPKSPTLTVDLKKEIGSEGANSRVFIAVDTQLNAKVVVKKIEKTIFDNEDEYFLEARKLYSVPHPNIVAVLYACEDEEFIYIVMPYYKQGSLNSLMSKRHLSVREIIRYSLQFLTGLNYIHSNGLVHFDIKPTNILLTNNNEASLADFGLANYLDENGFAAPESMYMSHLTPESYVTPSLTIQSDIYQVGLTLYRMCNGSDEFYSQMPADDDELEKSVTNGTFPNRKLYLPHIPNKLKKIINKCLEVDPDKRYTSVLSLMNDIATIDGNIDWTLSFSANSKIWVSKVDDKLFEVSIKDHPSLPNYKCIHSTKTTASGTRRVVNQCLEKVENNKSGKILFDILHAKPN